MSRVVIAIVSVVVLAVLLGGGVFFALPAIRYSETVKDAESAREAGDLEGARAAYAEAVEIDPSNPRMVTALIDVTQPLDNRAAFDILHELAETGNLPAEEEVRYVTLAYENGENETADAWLEKVRERDAFSPEVFHLEGLQAFFTERDLVTALNRFNRVLGMDPEHARAAKWRGELLMLNDDPVALLNGKQSLLRAARSDEFVGLRAITLLLGALTGRLTETEQRNLLLQMERHPLLGGDWQFYALQFRHGLYPDEREEVLEEMIAEFSERNPALLTSWLNQIGNYTETLNVIESLEDPGDDVREHEFQALLLLERIDDAESLLVGFPDAFVPSARAARLSEFAVLRGDEEAAGEYWDEALSEVSEDSPALTLVLARQALSRGWPERAFRAYQLGLATPEVARQVERPVWGEYFVSALQGVGEEEALQVALDAVAIYPNSAEMNNNAAYLAMLMGREDVWKPAVAIIEENMEALFTVSMAPQFANTLALSHLLEGEPEAAQEIMDRIVNDWRELPPSNMMVFALVAAESSQPEFSTEVLALLDRDRLLEAEREFLEQRNL